MAFRRIPRCLIISLFTVRFSVDMGANMQDKHFWSITAIASNPPVIYLATGVVC